MKMLKKNPDIVSRKIAGELFLVPIRGKMADMQEIFTLNPVGEYIWQELDRHNNLDDISAGVVSAFNCEKDDIDSDVQEFVAELLKAGLLADE